MKSELNLIKFTLTREMAEEMININNIKKKLIDKKLEYNYLKESSIDTKTIEKEIKILEDKINDSKKRFIRLFQSNNKEQIKSYLDLTEKQEI